MTDLPERHAHTSAYRRGDRSAETLAREIDAERRNVSQTIEALQEKFTIGNIVEESWDRYGPQVNEVGRNLVQAVARNPLPVAVTAAGLAWMLASIGQDLLQDQDDDLPRPDGDLYKEDFVAIRSDSPESGKADSGRPGARRPYGTASITGYYEPRHSIKDRVTGAAGDAYQAASDAGKSAAAGAREAAHSAMDQAGDAAEGIGGRLRQAADTVKDYAESAIETGRDAAHSIGDTAREARDRVSRRAHGAADRAGQYRRQGRRQAEVMMRDHPLLLGAAAFAIGAGIACTLPRSRVEDEYFGEYSDRAWEMAKDEAEKARRVAGAVADEARDIASEEYEAVKDEVRSRGHDLRQDLSDAASHLRDRAGDEAEDALHRAESEAGEIAGRLGDAAREEADRQGLGDPHRPA